MLGLYLPIQIGGWAVRTLRVLSGVSKKTAALQRAVRGDRGNNDNNTDATHRLADAALAAACREESK